MFARLSPNLYWDTNYVQAIAFIEAHASGSAKHWTEVKIWTPYSYEGKPCGYGNNNELAWQILDTGDISLVRGEKIESFMHNFVNGPDDPDTKATVDIWATRVMFNDPLVEPHINDRDGSYAYMERAYQIAGEQVGLTAKQIQAVTWVSFKNKYGRNRGPTDYVDRFNEWIQTPMEERLPPSKEDLAPRPGENRNQMNLFGSWWKDSEIDWSLADNDYGPWERMPEYEGYEGEPDWEPMEQEQELSEEDWAELARVNGIDPNAEHKNPLERIKDMWKGAESGIEQANDFWNTERNKLIQDETTELYQAIMANGGIKTREDDSLRTDYQRIPNTFKRRDGIPGDDMANLVASEFPHLGIYDENSLIEVLNSRFRMSSWWSSAAAVSPEDCMHHIVEAIAFLENSAEDKAQEMVFELKSVLEKLEEISSLTHDKSF